MTIQRTIPGLKKRAGRVTAVTMDDGELLSQAQVIRALGICYRTFVTKIKTDESFPKPKKIGGVVRYLATEINAYLERCPLAEETQNRSGV